MTGLYGNLSASERHLTWDLLRDLYDVSALPWLVIGDFNEVVQDNEMDGGVPRNLNQMMRFQSALDDTELLDGFRLTWKPKLVSRRFLKPWTPPPNGWLKANLDGAFNPITRIRGVGVIVQDSNAVVVRGLCFRVSNGTYAEIEKAFAGRVAGEMANEYGYSPIVFDSDCLKLVKAVSDDGDDDSSFGQVVADVKQELSSLPCSFFSHVFRESNLVRS
ncbi:hypothetical protein ACLB2K_053323 [Fragaria x ananassa]